MTTTRPASRPRPPGPARCTQAARPTRRAAASGSSPRSTRPAPAAARSASPASPAPQQGVDRTFLYRHRDLLEKIYVLEASPPTAGETPGPAVTRASLQADLLAAHQRAARLNARIRQLETRVSQALGEQAWQQSGLSTPADTDALNNTIAQLEQQAAGLRLRLSERDDELAAARAANRELMAQLNATARRT